MQPSEMTNEKILSLAELCFYEDHSVEEDQQTAAVLRDYVRMRSEIAKLRERIKVAEDALDKIYKCIDNRYGVDASMLAKNIIADAIAAIRWKEEQ